jgi:hypothetical protein
MWLIPRNSDGCGGGRISLPALVKEALVRWYIGQGSRADEDAGIMLVQQARIGERWIACDCLDDGEAPPILTPAFLSEADTYYLRRLTSAKRPEHRTNCPFFREQATNRLSEVRTHDSAAEPLIGYFEVLRPAPENLAQRPETDATDDRTRQGSIPRLARLLWRLMALSGLNHCRLLREEDQPIFAGNRFVPVDSEFERLVLQELLDLRRALDGAGWTLSIEKPLFDILTPLGACRPDFLLEACARSTGEIRRIVVEAMGSDDPDYLASKAVTYPRMMQIAPVALVSPTDIEPGRVVEIVSSALAI